MRRTSTYRLSDGYVEALGGQLELRAVCPGDYDDDVIEALPPDRTH